MKKKILDILKKYEGEYVSGEKLSEELGITRSGIWKHMKSLKEAGYEIDSVSNKGYKLTGTPDKINEDEVSPLLKTKYIGRVFHHFNEIDSTNTEAKRQSAQNVVDGMVITAEKQSKGKGRLGRQWESPKGTGIWMSVVLTPDISPILAPKTTIIGAAAVYNALKDMGVDAGIKWPNDIVVDGKKVCGILTEMNAEIDRINYIVLGVGINVNMDSFPEELKEKATSLKLELKEEVSRKELTAKVLNYIEYYYDLFKNTGSIKEVISICKRGSVLLGKDVKVINCGKETLCKAIDIDEDGELIVQYEDGSIHKVLSGEVSVRGIYGYV